MTELIFWIITVSVLTFLGSWYARKYERSDVLIGLYVAFVIFSNIAAVKTAEFDLKFVKFFAPAAVLIFSVTFLMTDIVNEKFGRRETQKMIFIAFLAQIAAAFFSWLILILPPAPFWENQKEIEIIFNQVPRVMLASWIAFLISENFDAYIFDWFRKMTEGRHLWMRNVFSSIPAMALDSILFVGIAFYGVLPVLPLIIGLIAVKWLVGIIDIPFMYLSRRIINGR